MQLPQITEVNGMRVLTTKQLAEMYEVDSKIIQYNFRYNKNKYIVNKHYIEITGDELRQLKTRSEFQSSLKYVKALYLGQKKEHFFMLSPLTQIKRGRCMTIW